MYVNRHGMTANFPPGKRSSLRESCKMTRAAKLDFPEKVAEKKKGVELKLTGAAAQLDSNSCHFNTLHQRVSRQQEILDDWAENWLHSSRDLQFSVFGQLSRSSYTFWSVTSVFSSSSSLFFRGNSVGGF